MDLSVRLTPKDTTLNNLHNYYLCHFDRKFQAEIVITVEHRFCLKVLRGNVTQRSVRMIVDKASIVDPAFTP